MQQAAGEAAGEEERAAAANYRYGAQGLGGANDRAGGAHELGRAAQRVHATSFRASRHKASATTRMHHPRPVRAEAPCAIRIAWTPAAKQQAAALALITEEYEKQTENTAPDRKYPKFWDRCIYLLLSYFPSVVWEKAGVRLFDSAERLQS